VAATTRPRVHTRPSIAPTAPEPSADGHRYSYPSAPFLYEQSLARKESQLAENGPLVVETGVHTGRSARDKFVVEDGITRDTVWWGKVNQRISREHFAALQADVLAHLESRPTIAIDLRAGANLRFAIPVQLTTEHAWAALFARNLFLSPDDGAALEPFRILHAPTFDADPAAHGARSSTVIAISFSERTVIIAGTHYAGEIKKSIFSVLQYLLPEFGVATMHCAANMGGNGDVALFFGLSGTGKTTLSTDKDRMLVGDDEHGWSDEGVFNFEGGSYAKVIKLSPKAEPGIWNASHRFGTVLENVVMDPETRALDLDDASLTENTRSAFPLNYIPGASETGLGGHPRHIIFLTADAFGVLPPVAKLTREQAHDWYLAGYTSKLAGTEKGVTEPAATFSACFGDAFLTHPPQRYAELLDARIAAHNPSLWLVNTGWTGGAYGTGERISIAHTRAIIRAILAGELEDVQLETEPFFGLHLPTRVKDVPREILRPWHGWSNYGAYEKAASRLAADFRNAIR
jgi:phosphoenolpyruvate carboxykinase (ATP)